MQSITLQTNDSIVASGDALGQVQFAASNELDGGASRYIVGRIYGQAEGTFTASSNPASIVFATSAADSLPASGKIKISHEGHILPLQDNVYDLGSPDFRFRDLYVTSEVTSPSGNFDYIFFDTGVGDVDLVQGQMNWNSEAGTVELGLTDDVKIQIGQTVLFRIKNSTGSTLSKGQAVYASGVLGGGQIIQAAKFTADDSVDEVRFIGLMIDDLANGEDGYVNHFGHIKNVDLRTSNTAINPNGETWAVGDILYVDGTTAGGLTKTAPQDDIYVAMVLADGQNGELFVRITDPGHMTDLHDVNFSGLVDNNLMVWNSGSDYWEPSSGLYYVNGDLGIGTSSPNATLHVYNSTPSGTIFNAEGTNGSLFSVVDNLSGVLMSVNTIAGLPVLEVNSDYSITAGRFNQNDFVLTASGDIGMGIAAPSGKLHVVGEAYVDNLKLDGNTLSTTDTNGDLILNPNGDGAIRRDDGGSTRGNYAIDLQTVRANVNQIAAGNASVISGGCCNTASGTNAVVSGGSNNRAYGNSATVAGGATNLANIDGSVVSGGILNNACGSISVIGGGCNNCTTGTLSSVVGGWKNTAAGCLSTVSGGYCNCSTAAFSTSIGGVVNRSTGYASFVGGGGSNCATGSYSTVAGGQCNCSCGFFSFIGAGKQNVNNTGSYYDAIVAGTGNATNGSYSFIGAGSDNRASATRSVVVGGYSNTANGLCSFVGGGSQNIARCHSAVVGGASNCACYCYDFIGGGLCNFVNQNYGTISGGRQNTASCFYTTIAGGCSNTASNFYATVAGGQGNCAAGMRSFVGAGRNNCVTSLGTYSNILGGCSNSSSGAYSSILGGKNNSDGGCSSVFILGTGITATSANTTYTQKLNVSHTTEPSGTLFNVEGSNGSLFSVVDNLSGVLMSVNNNAGLPVFEVYDDDSIIAGRFAQNDFVIGSGGNVGIGTDSAVTKLDVSGVITASGGNSNEWNQSYDWVAASGGLPYVTGVGTANQVAFFNDTDSITSESNLYWNSTNNRLGIGTSSPAYQLDIQDSSSTILNASFGSSAQTQYSTIRLISNTSEGQIFRNGNGYTGYGGASSLNIFNVNGPIAFHPHTNTNLLYLSTNGNVGIGTNSPTYKLDVRLAQYGFANFETTTAGYGGVRIADANQPLLQFIAGSDQQQIYGGTDLHIRNYTAAGAIKLFTNSTERMRIASAGNVGIGTTSPSYKLHVVGDITATSAVNGASFAIYGDYNNKLTKSGNDFTLSAGQTTTDVHLGYYNAGNLTKVLTVDSSENKVGILNTAPDYTLDVAGSGRFTGNLTVGGSALYIPSGDLSVGDPSVLRNTSITLHGNQASNKRTTLQNINGDTYLSYLVGSQNLHFGTPPIGGSRWLNIKHYAGSSIGGGHKFYTTDNNDPDMVITSDGSEGFVGINQTSPSYNLDVNGTSNLGGDVIVGGNLTVNGTTISTNVDTIEIQDPIITLGLTSGNIVTNDSYDRGIAMVTNDGTAFMGWDNSANKFVMLASGVATNGSGNYDAGTWGQLDTGANVIHQATNGDVNGGLIIKSANDIYSNKLYATSVGYHLQLDTAGSFGVNIPNAVGRYFSVSSAGNGSWQIGRDGIRNITSGSDVGAGVYARYDGYLGFNGIGSTYDHNAIALHQRTGHYDWGLALHYRASGVGVGLTRGLVLDNRGRVGINDETPSYQLDVNGTTQILPTAATETLILGRSTGYASVTSTASNELILDSDGAYTSLNHYSSDDVILGYGGGDVGIGTATPSADLQIGEIGYNQPEKKLIITGYNGSTIEFNNHNNWARHKLISSLSNLTYINDGNNSGNSSQFTIGSTTNAALFRLYGDSNSIVQMGSNGGYPIGYIGVKPDTGANYQGGLVFTTRETLSTTHQVYIDKYGQLGLGNGTNALSAKLDVRGSAVFNEGGADYDFRVEGSGAPNALFVDGANGNVGIGTDAPPDKLSILAPPNSLVFGAKDTTRNNHIFQLLADDSAGNGELRLYSNSSVGTHTKQVEIASQGSSYFLGGNVGVGTSSPVSKLDVSGVITATGGNSDEWNQSYDWINSSGVAGSGVASRLALWDGTNSISSDSRMYYSGNDIYFNSLHGVFGYSVGVRGNRGTNVGLESNGSNGYLALAAGGSEKVRIDTNGYVGIGTTSPTSTLTVNGTFYTNVGNAVETTLFEHSGASTPVPFNIRKTGYSGNVQTYGILHLDMGHSTVGGGSNLHFRLLNSSGNYVEYGGIGASIDDATFGSEDGSLHLYTTAGATTRQERLTILSAGNVGIGTTTPAQKLHIASTSHAEIQIDAGTNSNPGVRLTNDAQNWVMRLAGDSSDEFQIRQITGTPSNRLVINTSGNVGIGADSPTQKLDIRYPASGGMALLKATDTNDGLLFGDMAFSSSNDYQGMKHVTMTGAGDYMMISDGYNTYISARSGYSSIIGAGGNGSNGQIKVSPTEVSVNDNGSSNDFRVESNNNANMLFVDGVSDMVGIGTGSPSEKLHVASSVAGTVYMEVENTATSASCPAGIKLTTNYAGTSQSSSIHDDWTGAGVVFKASRDLSTSQGGFSWVSASNTTMMALRKASGSDWLGIGTASPGATLDITQYGAAIHLNNTGGNPEFIFQYQGTEKAAIRAGSGGTLGFYHQLDTRFHNSSNSEIVRITDAGNVGIGTTSPSTPLHVYVGSSNPGVTIESDSTAGSWIRTKSNQTGAQLHKFGTNANGWHLYNDSISAFRLTVLNNGNFGVGTASPSTQLDVVGSGNFSGDVTIDGHLSAATKSFYIDHPTKEGKLQYGSLESPYHGVRLTGRGKIEGGKCVVDLPDYISALVRDDENVNIQITNYKHSKILYVDDIDISNNCFTVKCDSWFGGGKEFFWSFTAVRKDVQELKVEC